MTENLATDSFLKITIGSSVQLDRLHIYLNNFNLESSIFQDYLNLRDNFYVNEFGEKNQ